MEEVKKLLKDLSWDNPKDIVDTAINKLIQMDDEQVRILLQPGDHSCWENAAQVLKKMGYPKNELALPGLIDWLRDMNWPGARTAKEILFGIDQKVLVPVIEGALRKAYLEEDFIWLACLKELVQELGIDEAQFSLRTSQLLKLEEMLSDIQF